MLNSCKRENQMDIRDFQQLGKDKQGNLSVEYIVRAEHPFTFVEKHFVMM